MMGNNQYKSFGFKKLFIVLFAIYLAALTVRLYDLNSDDYQADEYHWIDRSRGIIERFTEGDYLNLTSHLDHPGIPPAVLMAIAEVFAQKYNNFYGYQRGDLEYVDSLRAARTIIAIVSSLVVPLIFYFLFKYFLFRRFFLLCLYPSGSIALCQSYQ